MVELDPYPVRQLIFLTIRKPFPGLGIMSIGISFNGSHELPDGHGVDLLRREA